MLRSAQIKQMIANTRTPPMTLSQMVLFKNSGLIKDATGKYKLQNIELYTQSAALSLGCDDR